MEPFYDTQAQALHEIPEEFTDKEFEANFNQMCNRLNGHLKENGQEPIKSIFDDMANHQASTMTIEKQKEQFLLRQEVPYKSSHISHIAGLKNNRDGWSKGIKNYDVAMIKHEDNINLKNKI